MTKLQTLNLDQTLAPKSGYQTVVAIHQLLKSIKMSEYNVSENKLQFRHCLDDSLKHR